jgi:aldehyde dehydrogenase (NAD+)
VADWEYSPAPESPSIVSIDDTYGLFIGGKFVDPASGEYFKTINPATEEVLAAFAVAGEQDVDAAVGAARAAFEDWRALEPAERGRYLFRIARIIQERSRELAVLESINGGKPIKESRDVDVPLTAAHFFYYAGWADKLEYALPGRGASPVGVCGQIIPWNFPLLMLAWKIAPALATGNTVVLKPAETTPLTALHFAGICEQADLPPGVVNIITGAGDTGAALVRHPDVDKIAFTGSTEVGKEIQRSLAGSAKRLTLELGGKAANIVFDDAALDQAIEGVVNGIFFNQGHVCCAGSRLLIQESIADRLLPKLKRRLSLLRVGDPLDKNTDIGAINSRDQLNKIKRLVEVGVDEGAELYQPPCEIPDKGFWFPPTVFTGVSQSHRIAQEEIFGPVLSVLTFRTPEEAVEKANNTPYGLSAGVWTEKGSRILWMADRLKAGVVWANTFNRFDPTSPFGGYKESGFGREGGRHGLEPYVRMTEPAAPKGTSPRAQSRPDRRKPAEDIGSSRVRKTYKLFIGGKFPRSESRRSYEAIGADGSFLTNAVRASRKDVRDAVAAARSALTKWAGATAYNRGQVLYRIAEMLESRRDELEYEVQRAEGEAGSQVDDAVESFVHYAGWTDKLAQVAGNLNPVAGDYFNITSPEPSGIAAIVCPEVPSLAGLVERIPPALCSGDVLVVLASERHPLPAVTLAECLATADVPAGVVNILTGRKDELVPVLASHLDIDVLDVTGIEESMLRDAEEAAAGNVKRIVRPGPRGPEAVTAFMDMKTVWHPKSDFVGRVE